MTDLASQIALNAEMLEQRLELGDKVDLPREVEHFAHFRRYAKAEAAAARLDEAGYEVHLDRKFTKTSLRATTQVAVNLETANTVTEAVFTIVKEHGGEYDGWGAEVVE